MQHTQAALLCESGSDSSIDPAPHFYGMDYACPACLTLWKISLSGLGRPRGALYRVPSIPSVPIILGPYEYSVQLEVRNYTNACA